MPYGQRPSAGGEICDDLAVKRQQLASPISITGDLMQLGLYMTAEPFELLDGDAIAELTVRGLSQLDEPVLISTDERSGFPVVSVGRRVTSEQVAAAVDEE